MPGHRHRRARDRRGRHDVGPLTELFDGARGRLQHGRPVRQYGREVVEACLGRRLPLPRHHRRAGLADHLRRRATASGWRPRACCSPRASPRCTPPARSPPSSAWRSRASTRSTSWCSGRARRPSPRPGRSWSTRPWPRRTTWSRTSTSEWPADGGLYDVTVPGQHETGLALPWGGTSHPVWFKRRPAGGQRQGARRRLQPPAHAGRPADRRGGPGADRGPAGQREAPGARPNRRPAVMNQMPPREDTRINTSLDSVHASGPLGRAHCVIHGNCNYKQTGLLQAYAAYSLLQQPPRRAGLRVRLPGLRPPRAARRAAQLRPGHGAEAAPSTTEEDVMRVRLIDYLDKGASLGAGGALPDHGRAHAELRRRAAAVLAGRPGAGPVRHQAGRQGGDAVRATTRSRSPASSASPGPARSGARSTRATRRPRTASCSTSSTARA